MNNEEYEEVRQEAIFVKQLRKDIGKDQRIAELEASIERIYAEAMLLTGQASGNTMDALVSQEYLTKVYEASK